MGLLVSHPRTTAWQRQPLGSGGGVVTHRSAAKIHGLGGLTTDGVEITVPRIATRPGTVSAAATAPLLAALL
ncbi:MAG: hypothetical protein ACRDSE_22980, partial [Pseudonocardiaceae bacterium]